MKNVRAMLVPVKTRKIEASDSPITAQKAQNSVCAPEAEIDAMRNEKMNTKASGASITTHFRGGGASLPVILVVGRIHVDCSSDRVSRGNGPAGRPPG